jgi:hypothetical protein
MAWEREERGRGKKRKEEKERKFFLTILGR